MMILGTTAKKLSALSMIALMLFSVAAPLLPTPLQAAEETTVTIREAEPQGCIDWGGLHFDACVAMVANWVMSIAGLFLWGAGKLMDLSIKGTIDSKAFFDRVPIVEIGWKVFRDVANIGFIFALLWIAISTIIGTLHGDMKRTVVKVVVFALLVNFSLFIARAVFDASNIITIHFYDLMTLTEDTKERVGVSSIFMQGLKLNTLYDTKKIGSTATGANTEPAFADYPLNGADATINGRHILIIALGGTATIMVAAFVFLATAFMFLARSIAIMFLMVLSPLAFVGTVIPGLSEKTNEWWRYLITQSFFAPAFMIQAYIVARAINSEQFSRYLADTSFSQAFSSGVGWNIVMNYIVIIFLLIGVLKVASALGGHTTDFGMGIARTTRGLLAKGVGYEGRAFIRQGVRAPLRQASTVLGTSTKFTGWLAGKAGMKNVQTKLYARGEKMRAFGEAEGRTSIRRLDEKFGESKFGAASGFGKGLRAMTTEKLATMKLAGKSAEEAYHEKEQEREAAAAIDTREMVLRQTAEIGNMEADAKNLENRLKILKEGEAKAKAEKRKLTDQEKADISNAEEQLKTLKSKLDEKTMMLKSNVSKWTPSEFVKYIPEHEFLTNARLMEAATTAQFDALIKDDSRHFTTDQKKEMTRQRFSNVLAAFEESKERAEAFENEVKEFPEKLKKYEGDFARYKKEMEVWKALTPEERKTKERPAQPRKPKPPEPPSFPKDIYEKFSRLPSSDLAYLKNAEPNVFTHPYFTPNFKWGQLGKLPSDPSFPPDYHREMRRRKDYWGRYALDMMLGINAHIDPNLPKEEFDEREEAIKKVRAARQRLVNAGVDLKTGRMYDGREITDELKAELVDADDRQIDAETWKLAELTTEEKERIDAGLEMMKQWKKGRSQKEIPMGRSEVRNDPNLIFSLGRDTLVNWKEKDTIDIEKVIRPIVASWKRHIAARERDPQSKKFYISEGNLEFLNWVLNDPNKKGQDFYSDPDVLGELDPAAISDAFEEMRGSKAKKKKELNPELPKNNPGSDKGNPGGNSNQGGTPRGGTPGGGGTAGSSGTTVNIRNPQRPPNQ